MRYDVDELLGNFRDGECVLVLAEKCFELRDYPETIRIASKLMEHIAVRRDARSNVGLWDRADSLIWKAMYARDQEIGSNPFSRSSSSERPRGVSSDSSEKSDTKILHWA